MRGKAPAARSFAQGLSHIPRFASMGQMNVNVRCQWKLSSSLSCLAQLLPTWLGLRPRAADESGTAIIVANQLSVRSEPAEISRQSPAPTRARAWFVRGRKRPGQPTACPNGPIIRHRLRYPLPANWLVARGLLTVIPLQLTASRYVWPGLTHRNWTNPGGANPNGRWSISARAKRSTST